MCMETSIGKNDVCLYNSTVDCLGHTQCSTCGWNPKVEEMRVKQFLKEHAKTKKRRPASCPIKNYSPAEQKQRLGMVLQCYNGRCELTTDGVCRVMQNALDYWQQELDFIASRNMKKVEIP